MSILKCNIITVNVRGIRNRVKRRSTFSSLKDQNYHFYLLQETFSEPKDEHVWKNEWGGDLFFLLGSNHSKGVCILVNPSIVVNIENITATWLAQLGERQSAVREVEGSSPRPDQYSGS